MDTQGVVAKKKKYVALSGRLGYMKHMYTLTDSHTHSYTFILSFIPHSYTQSRTHSYLCGYKVSQPRKKKCRSIRAIGLHETHVHTHIHTHSYHIHAHIHTYVDTQGVTVKQNAAPSSSIRA